MRQMSGLDNLFFDLESAGSPMILSTLDIYDASTVNQGKVGFKDVIKVFESRFDRLTMLRQKLKRVPLGVDYPYWVDDKNFDLQNHFHKLTLPKPGSWGQLMTFVSSMQNKPFNEDMPLWEAYVVEGLNGVDGLARASFGLFIRMHHSFADGSVTMALRQTIHDDSSTAEITADAKVSPPGESPGSFNLLAKAYRNGWLNSFKTGKALFNMLPFVGRLAVQGVKDFSNSDLALLAPAGPPDSLLNPKKMTKERILDMRRFEYARVRSIRSLVEGSTFNDVAAAIMAGALNRYLRKRKETPKQGMTSMMSINLRREGDADGGNIVSQMTIPIYVDIDDPVERLRLIRKASAKLKKEDIIGVQRGMAEMLMAMPAIPLSPMLRIAGKVMGKFGIAQASTALSNVPSFMDARYLAGAKLTYLMGYGMLMPSVGLGNSVTIYDGWVMFGAVSCPEVMQSLDQYMQCVEESFDEYASLATATNSQSTKRSKSKKKVVRKKLRKTA